MPKAFFKSFCVVLIVAGIAIGLSACVLAVMSADGVTAQHAVVHQTWIGFVIKAMVCAALIALGFNLFDRNPFQERHSWSRPEPESRFYKAIGRM